MVSKKIGDEIATVFNDGRVISNHPLVYQGYCVVKVCIKIAFNINIGYLSQLDFFVKCFICLI